MTKSTVAERLKSMRVIRQWTQADLGQRAKIHTASIAHFETGERLPSCVNLCRLADALEVSTDYLLGRTDTWTPQPGQDDFVAIYHNLSDRSRLLLRAITTLMKAHDY